MLKTLVDKNTFTTFKDVHNLALKQEAKIGQIKTLTLTCYGLTQLGVSYVAVVVT